MTDITQVAERGIAMKMKWPHLKIPCNKRDIDSAFKRVQVHPDMRVILCAEFDADQIGLILGDGDATVIFLYSPPSDGELSRPTSPKLGKGVIDRREYISNDKNLDGDGKFQILAVCR